MNRRQMFCGLLVAAPALAAIAKGESGDQVDVPRNAVMTFGPSSWRIEVANRIVNESGEMWLAARERWLGRNPILVAFDDELTVEVTRAKNHWKIIERSLTAVEAHARDEARKHDRAMFHDLPKAKTARLPRIGDRPFNKDLTLRAYIYNGRSPRWLMSFDGYQRSGVEGNTTQSL